MSFNTGLRNRLANTKNLFQTETLKVLCVCSAGLLRSPSLANWLHKEFGFNTRAVGWNNEYALIPLESTHLFWADKVVCVEKTVSDMVELACEESNNDKGKIVTLDIPDSFSWMDEELLEEFERVRGVFDGWEK